MIVSHLSLEEALKGVDPRCPPAIKNEQTLVDVEYYSTDGAVHKGQVVIDKRLADDIRKVFIAAFRERFPIKSVIPVSRFGWSDDASMAANNSSGFNYREKTGGGTLSKHALGFAVDINPLYNPYIKGKTVLPPKAR